MNLITIHNLQSKIYSDDNHMIQNEIKKEDIIASDKMKNIVMKYLEQLNENDKNFLMPFIDIGNPRKDIMRLITKKLAKHRYVVMMKYKEYYENNNYKYYDFWKQYFDKILIDFILFDEDAINFQIITKKLFLHILNVFKDLYSINKDCYMQKIYINKYINNNGEYIIYNENKSNINHTILNKIFFFGDIHSSLYAIVQFIEDLISKNVFMKISDRQTLILYPYYHIFFLGDIVDRGFYSIECLSFILTLKIINPNNVFICRGNHETESQGSLNMKGQMKYETYAKNFCNSFNFCDTFDDVVYVYNLLPFAFFIFFNEKKYYVSHGTFDLCMLNNKIYCEKIKNFLEDKNTLCIDIINFYEFDYDYSIKFKYDTSNNKPCYLKDYLWGDYENINKDEFKLNNHGRNKYGYRIVAKFLNTFNIESIITGHQDTINIQIMTKDFFNNKKFYISENKITEGEGTNNIPNKHMFYTSVNCESIPDCFSYLSIPTKIIDETFELNTDTKTENTDDRITLVSNKRTDKNMKYDEKNNFTIPIQSDQVYVYIISAANISKRILYISYLCLEAITKNTI